jgi:hypothetical protein
MPTRLASARDEQRRGFNAKRTLRLIRAWQHRVRDPSLTALLVLEIVAIFIAAPLAAQGLPIARAVSDALVLVVLVVVVMLSHRWDAIILVLVGLVAGAASLALDPTWLPVPITVLRRCGDVLSFAALTWVVGHAVYAPGRITLQRLQGAVVLYLSFATMLASIYGLIWELGPDAFANLRAAPGSPEEIATMLYFSLSTLTTTGFGDIVAVDPFARSLANFEAVVGQFYLAITVAWLVTLELADRRQ